MGLQGIYDEVDSTWMTDGGVSGFGADAVEPAVSSSLDLGGIGSLAGMVLGGPVGAAVGGAAGSMLDGGSSVLPGGSAGSGTSSKATSSSSGTFTSGSFQTGGNDWITVAIIAGMALLGLAIWKK